MSGYPRAARLRGVWLHTLVVTLLAVLGCAHAASAETLVVMWDQNPEPNITAYRVFVGTSSGVYSETFDVSGFHTTFVYSNAVRGRRYYFAVAAQVDDSVWGPQSFEVAETAVAATGEDSRAAPTDAGAPARASAGVEVLATGLQPVTALAVSPAGVGLLVEGGRIVRAFGPDGVQVEAALETDADTRIESVALDPAFGLTGRVFLAASRTRRDGARELTIERHRLLGGGLGEAAAIIPGLAGGDPSRTLLAVAGDGRVFVAQRGAVLAFTSEGRVPQSHASGSPALGPGLARPSGMAWDEAGQAVWLSGRENGGALLLERLTATGAQREVRVVPVDGVDSQPVDARVPTAIVVGGGATSLAAAGLDHLVEYDVKSGSAKAVATGLATYGQAVAIAPTGRSGAEWYVVSRVIARDGTPSDTLLRVPIQAPSGPQSAP